MLKAMEGSFILAGHAYSMAYVHLQIPGKESCTNKFITNVIHEQFLLNRCQLYPSNDLSA